MLYEKVDGLAFVEREQQLLRDGIGAIVLLQHLQRALSARIAQDHRVGLEMRRDLGETYGVHSGGQLQRNVFAHQRKVPVVDGERGRLPICCRRALGRGGGRRESSAKQNGG